MENPEATSVSENLRGQVQDWQAEWIRKTLRYVVWIGLFMAVIGSYSSYNRGLGWVVPYYFGVWGMVAFITFIPRVSYRIQVFSLLVILYSLSIIVFMSGGLGDSGRLYLLTMLFITGLLLNRRDVWLSIGGVALTMGVLAWLFITRRITGYTEIESTNSLDWLALSLEMVGLGSFVALVVNYFVERFTLTFVKEQTLLKEVESQREFVKQQIDEQTQALSRRNRHLSALAQVARDAAVIHDLDLLLDRAAQLISERFGFYHVGIFLLSEDGEWAVLRAASSPGGKRMLERGHKLRVGHEGTVGYVVAQGEARITSNVGEDAVFFNNPDLPETRSVATLPLRARQKIIGALDVQSAEPGAFGEDEVSVLQLLADLIAVTIDNARLFQQAQESLAAERRAYGQLTREAWRELTRVTTLRRKYDPLGVLASDETSEEMQVVLRTGTKITTQNDKMVKLSTPIKERGQVIGVLEAYKSLEKGPWTQEEISLLETLTLQLGETLESARLYQESQRRAMQEQLVSEITSAIRESLDMKTIVQTAARSIGESLGLSELIVRVGTADTLVSQDSSTGTSTSHPTADTENKGSV